MCLASATAMAWECPSSRAKGFLMELDAARKGDTEAQFSVGICFSKGQGTAVDPRQAFKWYLKAAKRGHDDAAYNVGYFYEKGRGVKANKRKAKFWYDRAESLKNQESHKAMGTSTIGKSQGKTEISLQAAGGSPRKPGPD